MDRLLAPHRRPHVVGDVEVAALEIPEVVDGGLGVVDEVEHGQDELAFPGQKLGKRPGLEGFGSVVVADDMVVFRHRWRLRCEGFLDTR